MVDFSAQTCRNCPLTDICVAAGNAFTDDRKPGFALQRELAPGQALSWSGERASGLHVVRSGTIKLYTVDESGQERILGFFGRGSIIGAESLNAQRWLGTAQAIDAVSLCGLSVSALQRAIHQQPNVGLALMRMTSAALAQSLLRQGEYTAEQRVAAFLLSCTDSAGEEGVQPHVQLAMTRREIASYLGLVTETVSRVMTRLRHAGVIATSGRCVTILESGKLAGMAGLLASSSTEVALLQAA